MHPDETYRVCSSSGTDNWTTVLAARLGKSHHLTINKEIRELQLDPIACNCGGDGSADVLGDIEHTLSLHLRSSQWETNPYQFFMIQRRPEDWRTS